MSEVSGTSIPKLPRGVRLHFDQVRQAHVLLAPERAFNVDGNAVAVLQLVDGTRSVDDIAGVLAEKYAADKSVIARDIGKMIDDLIAKRVMEAA
ncbi:Pyrroloquinoline-quinone synthase / Coenzyme PQQ synthesis protein D (fragment) [Beijerinckiaceae bacterium RH AL1]